jgi:glycosyltransferase involved in cell wall biosynthesis
MRIAILNNWAPFVRGGAEHLAETLVRELEAHGHRAELYRLPLRWNHPLAVEETMLTAGLVDLAGVDRVIGLKFPAYLVPHHDKAIWLIHQLRQVYDLWDAATADPDWSALRSSVRRADHHALSTIRHMYCVSDAVANRLQRYNGLAAGVLHAPLADPGQYRCDGYGDYVFAAGRINGAKRQLLAVQAMKHTRSHVRLVVAGPPDTPEDLAALRSEIDAHDLGSKVTLIPEFISEERKVDLYAGALGSVYLPYEEDSYGYVTAESMLSRKPVVTSHDNGDLKILVTDQVTGLVTAPDPREIGQAFDDLAAAPGRARTMGEAGRDAVLQLDLSWDRVVRSLTAP